VALLNSFKPVGFVLPADVMNVLTSLMSMLSVDHVFKMRHHLLTLTPGTGTGLCQFMSAVVGVLHRQNH
jgi:hypothetical protein